ncbi:MAG: glycosyltransferase family 39 protein, partial [Anaerolineae bacterium]|nr:glycosyltransferase family 39 protein [Anaerolineae bacterium]
MGRNSEGLAPSHLIVQRLRALGLVAVGVVGLGAAYLGQRALDRPPVRLAEWGLLLGGAAALALCCRGHALERAREQPGQTVAQPRLSLLGLALVLAAAAFPGFAGNRFRLWSTVLWMAALASLYTAFARRGAGVGEETARREAGVVRLSWEMLLLAGIILVGAFLRLHRLDAIPAEMGTDMPLKYENAREIMRGQFMIFCPRYPGREALLFYLIALYGRLFGLGFFAIKVTTVLLGVATIPALYLLARELYGRHVAVVAAALLALSRWHVTLS